jgi:hypothetical protein
VSDQIHHFKVGQIVEIIPSVQRSAAEGAYEITRLVPADARDPQYRLKSVSEKHERVVGQSDLQLVATANRAINA